jgi:hypothetical protein
VACAAEVLCQAQVKEEAVADVAAADEGGLHCLHQMVKGKVEAVCDCLAQQLDVTVEEGDGPVAAEVGEGFWVPLVDQDYERLQERAKGGG